MSLNMDAIRKKLKRLERKPGDRVQFWSLKPGEEANIRIVAFPDNDGQPFKELMFYYNIGDNRGLLAPYQFNERDPFQELIKTLREDDSPESRDLIKKISPKMRCYAAVLVRGKENEGLKLWSFGYKVYQTLLRYILNDDYGDYTCPKNGRDLTVTVTKPAGQTYPDTSVVPRVKTTPLLEDPEKAEELLNSVPNVLDVFSLKTYDELEKIISDWLEGDDDESEGTEHRSSSSDDGEEDFDIADDEQEETTEAKKPKVKKSASSKSSSAYVDIDNVFKDLED